MVHRRGLQTHWRPLCAQRPLGWAEYTDERGVAYFHNVLSGEAMWEHPQLAQLRGLVAAVRDAERVLRPAA